MSRAALLLRKRVSISISAIIGDNVINIGDIIKSAAPTLFKARRSYGVYNEKTMAKSRNRRVLK